MSDESPSAPIRIATSAPESINGGTTEHSVLVLSAKDKVPVAVEIASRPARTLFFVRTKHGADRLARQFSQAGVEALARNLSAGETATGLPVRKDGEAVLTGSTV